MVLMEHILDHGKEIAAGLSDSHRGMCERAASDLVTWCERESFGVEDAPYTIVDVDRFFSVGDRIVSMSVKKLHIPLAPVNKDMTRVLDRKFLREIKALKLNGVKSSHVLIYCKIFEHMVNPGNDDKYSTSFDKWLRLKLFFNRIESTVRIVERYKNIDKFGPVVVSNDEGVSIDYRGEPLKRELEKRGLLKPRKGLKDG